MIKSTLTFLSVFAVAKATMADGIIERGSWTLWEEQSANGNTCYMQAVDSELFRKEDFLLEIYHAKNNYDSPIEVILKINKNRHNNTALKIDLTGGTQLGFADLAGTRERFWAVPKNLSILLEQLKSGQNVAIKAFGGSKDFNFEIGADGFAEVYAAFEKHCNNGYALVEPRFEKEFLMAMPNTFDPSKLTAEKTTALRNAYFAAFGLYRQVLGAEAQLTAVLAKYQNFIDEQNANRGEKNQILSVDLPQSLNTLANAQQAQIDLRAEINHLAQQIPGLREQVQRSTQELERVRAILAPLLPEFNRLTGLVRSSEDSLRSAQSRLSFIDSRLRELSRQIADLQFEAEQVDRHLRQARLEQDRAIAEHRDAEFRSNQFDVRREIERRLNDNGEYRRIKSERDAIDPQAAQLRSLVQQIEGERVRIVRDLETCRAEAGRDCSEIEAGLARADQLLNEKRNELRQLDLRRSELDRAMVNAENQVQTQVRRDYDLLVERETRARQNVVRIEDEIRRDQDRLNAIRNIQLPRLSDEQRSLNNERPAVLSQISSSERQLNQAERDLQQFRSVNDYDRKANDVAQKQAKLSQDQAALDQVLRAKASNEQRLQEAINTEARMKQRIADLNARVLVLDARNVELDKLLKNLPAERAPIDARMASLQKNVNKKKEEMLKLLKG